MHVIELSTFTPTEVRSGLTSRSGVGRTLTTEARQDVSVGGDEFCSARQSLTPLSFPTHVAGDPTAMAKDGLGGDNLPAVMAKLETLVHAVFPVSNKL
jgi:hypothetical protein